MLPPERKEGGVAGLHVTGRWEIDRRCPAPAPEDRGDVDRHPDLAERQPARRGAPERGGGPPRLRSRGRGAGPPQPISHPPWPGGRPIRPPPTRANVWAGKSVG